MAKSNRVKPTESELEILQILWANGPSSVRQVNEVLNNNEIIKSDQRYNFHHKETSRLLNLLLLKR